MPPHPLHFAALCPSFRCARDGGRNVRASTFHYFREAQRQHVGCRGFRVIRTPVHAVAFSGNANAAASVVSTVHPNAHRRSATASA